MHIFDRELSNTDLWKPCSMTHFCQMCWPCQKQLHCNLSCFDVVWAWWKGTTCQKLTLCHNPQTKTQTTPLPRFWGGVAFSQVAGRQSFFSWSIVEFSSVAEWLWLLAYSLCPCEFVEWLHVWWLKPSWFKPWFCLCLGVPVFRCSSQPALPCSGSSLQRFPTAPRVWPTRSLQIQPRSSFFQCRNQGWGLSWTHFSFNWTCVCLMLGSAIGKWLSLSDY